MKTATPHWQMLKRRGGYLIANRQRDFLVEVRLTGRNFPDELRSSSDSDWGEKPGTPPQRE